MKKRTSNLLTDIITMLLGLVVILPVVYGLFGAFRTPDEFASMPPKFLPASFTNLENFKAIFSIKLLPRYFLNSLIVAMLVSVVRLICASFSAYAFVYFRFPGRSILFFFILGTMMLPADTIIITNYITISKLKLTNTYLGMSIVSFVGASQMLMLRQSFRYTPRALREAAIIDGCGDLRYMLSILLPISRPVLVTLFVQSFVASWNTYLWPLLSTTHDDMRTIQVGISMLNSPEATNYETILAGAIVSLLPALFVFLFLRRQISKAMTGGALVG